MLPRIAVVCVALAGCGGKYAGSDEPKEKRGVEAAALPFKIVDARSGREVPEADVWKRLATVRAVCIGEEHPNPHHHWAQLRVVDEVAQRAGAAKRSFGLGMEMFQTPFQGVLDDFAAGKIDEAALLSRSGWQERWNYDFGLYRPIIARARKSGGTLLALNAPKELVKKMSRQGIDALTPDERKQVPELVLDDPQHRAWWDGIMASMGGAHGHGGGGNADKGGKNKDGWKGKGKDDDEKSADDRIYAVQVLWDETMADGASRWLAGGATRTLVILAGSGHCHDSAIVNRLKRRGVKDTVSVAPLIDDGKNVAAALAKPANDYLFVMSMPTPPATTTAMR